MSHATRSTPRFPAIARIAAATLAATCLGAPLAAYAEDVRTVACAMQVDYLFNNVLRSTYQRDFTVSPGVPYKEDFSTVTRFRFFDASATHEADKSYRVTISYYNDVGVFDFVDFGTELTLREDRLSETNRATHSYFTSIGAPGERTTNWTLTCTRVKP